MTAVARIDYTYR